MSSRMEALAADLERLRAEIVELDAIEEPTEEQVERYDAALGEFDTTKTEYDKLVERAERVEQVRQLSLRPSNREAGTPEVIVREDPFEGVASVRMSYTESGRVRLGDQSVRDQAHAAFDKVRGLKDEQLESLHERIDTVAGVAEHALLHGTPQYREAFDEFMRTQGKPMYTSEQEGAIRAAHALGNSTGGYTLPTLLDPSLIHTGTASKNPVRRLARVVSGTQNVWHGVSVGNVSTYWHAEAAAMTEGSPTYAGPSVTAAMLTAYVKGSYEIFEDSNLLQQLPGLIGEAFDYKESDAFVTGSGSGEPKGIVTAISATSASTVTATTRGAFTTASAVDVFALLNSLPSRYEDSSTWVANKATFNTIKQMSTGSQGSYFWSDFNAGIGAPLLGSPIAQSSAMSSAQTSGTILIVLGDWNQFVVYDRIGTSVEFMQNAVDGSGLPTGERALIAHKRVGSDCTDINAFRFLKT